MRRFTHVIHIDDGAGPSCRALSRSVELARDHGAELTLFVLTSTDDDGTPGAGERRRALKERHRRRVAAELDQCGLPGEASVVVGGIDTLLRNELRPEVSGLVVKVARGEGARWWTRRGALERRILRESPWPVWLAHPAQRGGVDVVLAAIDVAETGAREHALGVLRVAAGIAQRTGAELHVVHAVASPGDARLASRTRGLGPGGARRVALRMRARRRRRLERLLLLAGADPGARIHVCEGAPSRVVRRAASRLEADAVVVGEPAFPDFADRLLGTFPERLAGRIPASVVAVGETRRSPQRARSPLAIPVESLPMVGLEALGTWSGA